MDQKILCMNHSTKTYTSKGLQIIGNTFDMITIISRNYKNKHFIVDKVSPQASST